MSTFLVTTFRILKVAIWLGSLQFCVLVLSRKTHFLTWDSEFFLYNITESHLSKLFKSFLWSTYWQVNKIILHVGLRKNSAISVISNVSQIASFVKLAFFWPYLLSKEFLANGRGVTCETSSEIYPTVATGNWVQNEVVT